MNTFNPSKETLQIHIDGNVVSNIDFLHSLHQCLHTEIAELKATTTRTLNAHLSKLMQLNLTQYPWISQHYVNDNWHIVMQDIYSYVDTDVSIKIQYECTPLYDAILNHSIVGKMVHLTNDYKLRWHTSEQSPTVVINNTAFVLDNNLRKTLFFAAVTTVALSALNNNKLPA